MVFLVYRHIRGTHRRGLFLLSNTNTSTEEVIMLVVWVQLNKEKVGPHWF